MSTIGQKERKREKTREVFLLEPAVGAIIQ
jgi:hypothetical protein